MATNTGTSNAATSTDTVNQSGEPSRQGPVRIDRDVEPAWNTSELPDWVAYTLIPLLSSGQKWTDASESKLSELAAAWYDLNDGFQPYAEPVGRAVRTIVTGVQSATTATFVDRAKILYGEQSGVLGVSKGAANYHAQTQNFAVETQYTKLSINVAFWVTVVAIAIWLLAAFFSAGSTTVLVGPYAAAARAAISRLLVRLATIAGSGGGAVALTRIAALGGATGRGLLMRVLASPLGRELIEEIGEEFFIDGMSQYQQMKMGTRDDWDWSKSSAAVIGAGTGAVAGMGVAGPMSRFTSHVPGLGGRAMNVGLTNVVASPAGSFIANGLVYGQWTNPFTVDSMTGAFFGGAGRAWSTSPFNTEVYTALAHPTTSLAAAYDAAARADAHHAGTAGPSGTAGGPTGGHPSPPGGSGDGSPGTSGVQVTAPAAGTTTAGSGHASGDGTGGRGTTTATPEGRGRQNRQSVQPDPGRQVAPAPDDQGDQDGSDVTPAHQPGSTTSRSGPQSTTASQSDPSQSDPSQSDPSQSDPSQSDPSQADLTQSDLTRSTPSAPDSGAHGAAPDPGAHAAVPDPGAHAAAQGSGTHGQDLGTRDSTPTGGDTAPDAGPPDADAGAGAQSGAGTSGHPTTADAAPDAAPDTGLPATHNAAVRPGQTVDPVFRALADAHPSAVLMPDGSVVVPLAGSDIVVPGAAMADLRQRAERRARQVPAGSELDAEVRAMLDDELVAHAAPEGDPYAASLAVGQPAGLRGDAALQYAVDHLASIASLTHSGGLFVLDESGGYIVSPELFGALRTVLEELARDGRSPAMLRSDALTGLSDLLAYSRTSAPLRNAVTSTPGTVTARVIEHTRFVADGRADGSTLSYDAIGDAIGQLLTTDFQGEGVLGWEWRPDDRTLIVRTREHGELRFTAEVGPLHSGLMARTKIVDAGNQHYSVRFAEGVADDQVARVWLHEITDTLHHLVGPRRRRFLPGGGARQETTDACLPARLNEHRLLVRQWHAATTPAGRAAIRADLDGLARELIRNGHLPPPAPWTPRTRERPTHTPDALPPDATASQVRQMIETMRAAEDELQAQIDAWKEKARESAKKADEARREAKTTALDHDRIASERARGKWKERAGLLDQRKSELRIAQAYQEAIDQARRATRAYQFALHAGTGRANPIGQGPAAFAEGLRRAREAHADYREAMRTALPDEIAMTSVHPAAEIAHLTKLTAEVNKLLAKHKAATRFTADQVEHMIRADFRRVLTENGLVVKVGKGRSAVELKLRLELSDLFEVLNPGMKSSEIMRGSLPQGGRAVRITEAMSADMSFEYDTKTLADTMPLPDTVDVALRVAKLGVKVSTQRGWSHGATSGDYGLGGAVQDFRGEAPQFDAAATWTVAIRTSPGSAWQDTTTISSGEPGDAVSQRIWVPPVYADQPPEHLRHIDPDKQTDRVPTVFGGVMTNLDDLAERVQERLGRKGDDTTRQQISTSLTVEMLSRMSESATVKKVPGSANEWQVEMTRVLTDKRGRPLGTQTSAVTLTLDGLVGGMTDKEFQEALRVSFSGGSISESADGSVEVSASREVGVMAFLSALNLPGGFKLPGGPTGKASAGGDRSQSAFASEQAIHPSVQRWTGHTQGYRFRTKYKVTVQLIGDEQPLAPVEGEGEALLRFRVRDAYEFGAPVGADALRYNPDGSPMLDADGNQILVDDPDPTPVKGYGTGLPTFLGTDASKGQMRGAGPALVTNATGMNDMQQKVLARLAELGLVPKVVGESFVYSKNRLEAGVQAVNLQEVLEQLNDRRLETSYDQAAQDGIPVNLMRYGRNGAPETSTLLIRMEQHFDTPAKKKVVWKGTTDAMAAVNLDIGSDTAGHSRGRSWKKGGEASLGAKSAPEEGHDGISQKYGVRGGGNRTRNVGSSVANTGNVVTIAEDARVAVLGVDHTLTVELHHDGKSEIVATSEGTADLVIPVNLLPATDPVSHALGELDPEVMEQTIVLHADPNVVGNLDVPKDSPAYHQVSATFNVRGMIAHPESSSTGYETRAGIDADGSKVTETSVSAVTTLRESTLVAVGPAVHGLINLTLGSAGISWGGAKGHASGISADGSDSDGHGSSSDGLGAGYSRPAGRSVSDSILDIWGEEFLKIATGNQYFMVTMTDVEVNVAEKSNTPDVAVDVGRSSTGPPDPATGSTIKIAKRPELRALSEYHALNFYSQGRFDIPLDLVSDAVERFRNGSLKLDRTLATALLQRYLADMNAAQRPLPAEHDPGALIEALGKVSGMKNVLPKSGENSAQHLDQTLSRAADLVEKLRAVQVGAPFVNALGPAAVESFTVTDPSTGEQTRLHDTVRRDIERFAPGLLAANPVMSRSLAMFFARDRVKGHVAAMFGKRGKTATFESAPDVDTGRKEIVTVRLKLEPKGTADEGEFLGKVLDEGLIKQKYDYEEVAESAGYNSAHSFSGDNSGSDSGNGRDVGAATDRTRSWAATFVKQRTKIRRIASFDGLDRVKQEYQLVIEISRTSATPGRLRSPVRRLAGKVTRSSLRAKPIVHDATLVRQMMVGFTRPLAHGKLAEPVGMPDTRRMELAHRHYVSSLEEQEEIFDRIVERLKKLIGVAAVEEQMPELEARLSRTALEASFAKMAGPGGHEQVKTVRKYLRTPTLRKDFRRQGVDVRIKAHLSEMQVVGEYSGEIGDIDRVQEIIKLESARGRIVPVGVNGSYTFENMPKASISLKEQVSEAVDDVNGARWENTELVTGQLVIVRARVGYDLTYQHKARLPGRHSKAIGEPVHENAAATGTVLLIMPKETYEALNARKEAGLGIPRSWTLADAERSALRHVPPDLGRRSLIDQVLDAREKARETGTIRRVIVRENGRRNTYYAGHDGHLMSATPDGGFAEALGTVPSHLLEAAKKHHIELHDVFTGFTGSEVDGTFTDQVREAIGDRPFDGRPAPLWHESAKHHEGPHTVGSTGMTSVNSPSPALPGTPFARDARAAGVPRLSLREIVRQDVAAADFGGAVSSLTWTSGGAPLDLDALPAGLDSADLVVEMPGGGQNRLRVTVEEPGDGLNARIERQGPGDYLVRLAPGIDPAVVSSVLVHEITHSFQDEAAREARAPQGVIRSSHPGTDQQEGTDHCVTPRVKEHAHLSRRWRAATEPALRLRLTQAIDAVAADITARGHTPPAAPWGDGPAAPKPANRIAMLLNRGPEPIGGLATTPEALDRLAATARMAAITPAGPPGRFRVNTGAARFEVMISEGGRASATPAGSDLVLTIPAGHDAGTATYVAGQLAAHAARLAGRPERGLLAPGPADPGLLNGSPAFGVADAVTFARLRGLAEAGNAAEMRAVAEAAGLAPGTTGATARLVAAARAGELAPAHVDALQGHPALPERAASTAVERAAVAMNADVRRYGGALLDLVPPGGAPIPVHVAPAGAPVDDGVLVHHVDATRTIGANERTAAAASAAAIARARGLPEGPGVLSGGQDTGQLTVDDHRALAQLGEAVRQVETADAGQRTGRMRVLAGLAALMGVDHGGADRLRARGVPFADRMAALVDGPQPRGLRDYLDRARRLSNGTGWDPPDDLGCECPGDEPCRCGRRRPAPTMATA